MFDLTFLVSELQSRPYRSLSSNASSSLSTSSSTTLLHRLWSIHRDARFLVRLAQYLLEGESCMRTWPWIANARAGLWYMDLVWREGVPSGPSSYFKSTDGHLGQWDFSLTRLNLSLLTWIIQSGGIFLVDATKRGKRMPDSFSKTVPIWCCVWNRALQTFRREQQLPLPEDWDTQLYLPLSLVSESEREQIEARLESFVQRLLGCVEMLAWVHVVQRPLRPYWITPHSQFWKGHVPDFTGKGQCLPVVCITASQQATPERPLPDWYVQGSADDAETWSGGLTAESFWESERNNTLFGQEGAPLDDEAMWTPLTGMEWALDESVTSSAMPYIPPIVQEIPTDLPFCNAIGKTGFFIGSWKSAMRSDIWQHFDLIVQCTEHECPIEIASLSDTKICKWPISRAGWVPMDKDQCNYWHIPITEGKRGRIDLFWALNYLTGSLSCCNKRVLVHCAQGKERSVAVVVAALVKQRYGTTVTTDDIRRVLAEVQRWRVEAVPGRWVMKTLNSFLIPNGRDKEFES